jgi:hypothetical protein
MATSQYIMSRTPSANKNLAKGTAIRKAGFKTYMHSITDENGDPYYAWAATGMYNKGLGARRILKALVEQYPDVEPPSLAALGTFLKKYATVLVPQRTVDPRTRPDVMGAMYEALDAVTNQLHMASKMQDSQKSIPLPMVRQIAMNVVQIGKTITEAERVMGAPDGAINLHASVTNVQNNVTNASQIIIGDPQKGKELLDAFKTFENEVSEYQEGSLNVASN